MADDRIAIAPADPRAETVEPAREAPVPNRRRDEAKDTGGGEEIRLADLARRGGAAATRGEGGTPGETSQGETGTTGEPWTDAARAKR